MAHLHYAATILPEGVLCCLLRQLMHKDSLCTTQHITSLISDACQPEHEKLASY